MNFLPFLLLNCHGSRIAHRVSFNRLHSLSIQWQKVVLVLVPSLAQSKVTHVVHSLTTCWGQAWFLSWIVLSLRVRRIFSGLWRWTWLSPLKSCRVVLLLIRWLVSSNQEVGLSQREALLSGVALWYGGDIMFYEILLSYRCELRAFATVSKILHFLLV